MADQAHSNDIDEALEKVLNVSEDFLNQAQLEGEERGKEIGRKEAASLGQSQGKNLGLELGIYHGFVSGILSMAQSHNERFSDGSLTTAKKLEEILSDFPLNKPLTEENHSKLILIRAKIKVLCARVGFSPEFPSENIEGHTSSNSMNFGGNSELF